jgi:glucose/arabinose dehydrogenase
MTIIIQLLSLSWLFLTFPSQAVQATPFNIKTVAQDLGVPWGMAFISPNSLLITEREGTLLRLDIMSGKISNIDGLPSDIVVLGQGGLLDVAINKSSDWIYFSYSKNVDGQGATTLARAKLRDNVLTDWQDLLVSKSRTRTRHHFAGRLAFDQQGHVFMSIGDRGVRSNGQDLSNHAGTIIRLNLDGSVPKDNPFINDDATLAEIWTYGHRNPQGLFFNSKTQQFWSNEHGPRGGDEINLIKRGHNYGWPIISYGKEYNSRAAVGEGTHKAGMEQPIKVYSPSIAPSSLIQYQGKAFPQWQGQLLSGALKLRHLNKVTLDKQQRAVKEERLLSTLSERIRNVVQGPDDLIYLSTDTGKILMLSPNNELPE